MRVPMSWLKDYLPSLPDAGEVAEILTMRGIEVEGLETFTAPHPHIQAVRLLETAPHPQADSLKVCTVHNGRENFRVVCGAPNVKAGLVVPWVPPGASLGGQEIKIRKIRGVESAGMLCSEKELQLGFDASGLLVLQDATEPGTPLRNIHSFEDTVLAVGITPNRGDCLSIRGIARELSAACGQPMQARPRPEGIAGPAGMRIEILDPDACPVYGAAIFENVKNGISSLPVRYQLFLAGIKAISRIVDVTNWILWDTGQPMHAFDMETLHGGVIQVRRAVPGESLLALDHKEYPLTDQDLVIADARGAVAIAGIIGGEHSAVTPETRHVLLESALFQAGRIRSTAGRLGLRTDSSYRFERGTDPSRIGDALRAAAAALQTPGTRVVTTTLNLERLVLPRKEAPCRVERCNQTLGTALAAPDIRRHLESIDILEVPGRAGVYSIPSHRNDLEREIDLIEEVARLSGYDQIPEVPEEAVLTVNKDAAAFRFREKTKREWQALGFHEAVNYSFVPESDLVDLEPLMDRPVTPLQLANSLNPGQRFMRCALFPGLIRNWLHSFNYQQKDIRLFETGTVFGAWTPQGSTPCAEYNHVAFVLGGERSRHFHGESARDYDWYDLTGAVESFLRCFALGFHMEPVAHSWLQPARAVFVNKVCLGIFGRLDGAGKKIFPCKGEIFCGELSLDRMRAHLPEKIQVREVPRHPAIVLDMAFVVHDLVNHQSIREVILGTGIDALEAIAVFDIYRGDPVPEGKKSIAYSLTYRDAGETLTLEAANGFHESIKEELKNKVQAEFR